MRQERAHGTAVPGFRDRRRSLHPGYGLRARQNVLSRRNSGIGKQRPMWMLFCALVAVLCAMSPASADDTFRIPVGQPRLWNTSAVELAHPVAILITPHI